MQPSALVLTNLSKTFGSGRSRVEAVKNLSLTVEAGQVFGFLGHNGAGKSTTIRMIMDLIRPSQGAVQIFGQNPRRKRTALRRVGALVEGAVFYNYLTGRRNLEVLARTGGSYDPRHIEALLDRVHLADRADRPVKGYSTGMKQRMGLAAALLGDPDLVILDEPTNGLDPSGIQEIRHFIRALAHEQGKTVFLSSHLLSEVEQICDRVAIIKQGMLVREGAVVDLLSTRSELIIEAEPLNQAVRALAGKWNVSTDGSMLKVEARREDAPSLVQRLVEAQVEVYQVRSQKQTLEEYFLIATEEETPHV
jgi:ABC-2 type transport system ATP-binding protein